MNEPQNNSIASTIIFLCATAILVFAITLLGENFVTTPSNNINKQQTQTE